jgi:hypothetical protein
MHEITEQLGEGGKDHSYMVSLSAITLLFSALNFANGIELLHFSNFYLRIMVNLDKLKYWKRTKHLFS